MKETEGLGVWRSVGKYEPSKCVDEREGESLVGLQRGRDPIPV